MGTQHKIEELIRCCDEYPKYHRADGMTWVQCSNEKCKNRSQTYLTAGLSANKGWNEKRRKQLKVENLYNGKPHWYKKDNSTEEDTEVELPLAPQGTE